MGERFCCELKRRESVRLFFFISSYCQKIYCVQDQNGAVGFPNADNIKWWGVSKHGACAPTESEIGSTKTTLIADKMAAKRLLNSKMLPSPPGLLVTCPEEESVTMYTSENKPQEPASVLPRGGAVKNARKRGPMPAPLAANTPWGVVLKPVTRSGGSALSTEEADRTLEAGPGPTKRRRVWTDQLSESLILRKKTRSVYLEKTVIFCKICFDLIYFLNWSILWYYFLL